MIREEDPRFRNLERKTGIFVIVALVGVALLFLLAGLQRDLFTKKYNLRFTVDRGTGFSKGMPVKLSGFRIGRITDLSLNDQAMVDITIELDRKYSKWIRNDSSVKLVKEGLVGDSIVELSVGSLDNKELKDGDSLLYVKTKGLDELADEIGEKVKPVLIEVGNIIGYINDPDGDIKKTIRNLEILTRNLEKTRGNADIMLSGVNRNMDSIASRTNTLLENTTRKIDSLDIAKLNTSLEKLPPLLDKTDAAMSNIAALSADTRKMGAQVFPMVPGLLNQTEELLYSTDRLVNSLNNSWLIGGGGKTVGRSFRAGDSHD